VYCTDYDYNLPRLLAADFHSSKLSLNKPVLGPTRHTRSSSDIRRGGRRAGASPPDRQRRDGDGAYSGPTQRRAIIGHADESSEKLHKTSNDG